MTQPFYFYSDVATEILGAIKKKADQIEVSLDLNRTSAVYRIADERLVLDENNSIGIDDLKRIVKKENRVFMMEDGELETIEYRADGYYKLMPTKKGAPTFEISGVRMHRTDNYDPFDDAMDKASQVVAKGHKVLDTCSGLGYTAICSVQLGAYQVVTVERSPVIQELRKKNPWSAELYSDSITRISGDSNEFIETLESGSFDSVIHDPPRFSLSGELYSEKFYSEIFRVLKPGGKLFHYTGNPHKARKGNSFMLNCEKRLKKAGFNKVVLKPEFLGILALKR